jgi:hypothetical protein
MLKINFKASRRLLEIVLIELSSIEFVESLIDLELLLTRERLNKMRKFITFIVC